MRLVIVYCDRCGKKILEEPISSMPEKPIPYGSGVVDVPFLRTGRDKKWKTLTIGGEAYTLCSKCAKELEQWLNKR